MKKLILSTDGIQSQVSGKTIFHACSIDFEREDDNGEFETGTIEFTVIEMEDSNNGLSTYDIELVDTPENIDEDELKEQLLEMFEKENE